MENKLRDLITWYDNTKEAFDLISTDQRVIEEKTQKNIAQIEEYLMSKLPLIKDLGCSIYVRQYNTSTIKITGFCLVFCGYWLITEEGVYFEENTGFSGDNYYYQSGGRHFWKHISKLPVKKLNCPRNGLFVIWPRMKKMLEKNLIDIANSKAKSLQEEIQYRIDTVKNTLDFEL